MLQKEVAERVAAAPGSKTYGALSVLTQVAASARLAFTVPPGAFSPPPQVDSAVLHLRMRRAPPVPIADPARFAAVVRAAFSQRRKSLANALAAGLAVSAESARRRRAPPASTPAAAPRPSRWPSSPGWPPERRARLASPFLGPGWGPVVG